VVETIVTIAAFATERPRRYLTGSHAERDDRRRDPLAAALRYGYSSLHVAVTPSSDGELRLARSEHTLRSKVLEPLAARVAERGFVFAGQREPFVLLVELLGTPQRAYELLDDHLRAQPGLLTRFVLGEVQPASVTVVLTGPTAPRHLLARQRERLAFVDGTFADLGRPDAPVELVPLVSEQVGVRFGWDGRDEMPAEERHILRVLVKAAHADGRRVRFFGVPSRPRQARMAFWRELHAAGADLIGGADLAALARFLRRQRAGGAHVASERDRGAAPTGYLPA